MKKGDVVMHTFLRAKYVVEKVTPKKAKVRRIRADGTLSESTTMVLQRNLVVIKQRDEEVM